MDDLALIGLLPTAVMLTLAGILILRNRRSEELVRRQDQYLLNAELMAEEEQVHASSIPRELRKMPGDGVSIEMNGDAVSAEVEEETRAAHI